MSLFRQWFEDAHETEAVFPDLMTLATVGADGRPDARILLLKGFGPDGFVFYTNTLSKKGQDLKVNPYACLCFYWKSCARQVRVHGEVRSVTEAEANAYFASRPRGSQIGAWASRQSETLPCRDDLFNRVSTFEETYAPERVSFIPRPPQWSGYRLVPDRMEFWSLAPFRLHMRVAYTQHETIWSRELLNP